MLKALELRFFELAVQQALAPLVQQEQNLDSLNVPVAA
jgi:hypothetical protein